MRFVIFLLVIGGVLYGAYWYLTRERGPNPEHEAYCETLRQEYIEPTGDFNIGYTGRVRMVWKGCL